MRRALFGAVVFLAGAGAVACGTMPQPLSETPATVRAVPGPVVAGGNTATGPGPTDGNTPAASPVLFSFIGRLSPGNGNARAPQVMSWSNSAVLARVYGTGSVTVHTQYTADAKITVTIDGNAPLAVTDPNQRFTGLDPSSRHTVRLTKINEAQYSTVTFLGMDVDDNTGHLEAAPALSARRIEVIGDSISDGYGDLGANAKCSGTPANEDTSQAYGPLTGAALQADVMVTAWSGRGLYRNIDGGTGDVVPQLWRRQVATDGNTVWDPNGFKPDVVVIDLGTNDGAQGIPDPTLFQQAYTQFIANLRGAYGKDTHIFCAVGPMIYGDNLTAQRNDIQAVVSAANNQGDAKVHYIEWPTQSVDADGNGAGCDYHPSLATHKSMAASLTSAIKQALNW